MQQLRFENTLQVHFNLSGDPNGQRILPFVLITLVENAFKHGELKSTENPVKIDLDVCANGKLHFVCSNRKKTGPKELSTGIGLDNTRKRLELAYGENYALFIKNQRDIFTVDLTISL
jgi:sensor histidine kinase YesM